MMIRVESKKLSSEDCQHLATIMAAARKGTPLESDRSIEETAANIERISTNEGYRNLVALDEQRVIVGWIYYYVAFPLMTFISGFLPIVDKTQESEEIALSLIEASKRDIVEHGRSRLEIELELPTDGHRSFSEKIVDWYRKCDFQFAAEEVHMASDLSAIELPKLELPKGYVLKKFSEVSYEQLEGPGFQTFENSKDGLFVSMNYSEQKVTLKHFFDKSEPFIEGSSLVLEKENNIIGFIITRMRGEEAQIGPIGLIPEVRGQGLANYLLVRALKNLRKNELSNASLDMSITNHPARKLYKRHGFEDVYHKQFYYWSP